MRHTHKHANDKSGLSSLVVEHWGLGYDPENEWMNEWSSLDLDVTYFAIPFPSIMLAIFRHGRRYGYGRTFRRWLAESVVLDSSLVVVFETQRFISANLGLITSDFEIRHAHRIRNMLWADQLLTIEGAASQRARLARWKTTKYNAVKDNILQKCRFITV